MTTGYEDWSLDKLKAHIEKEQDALRDINESLHARDWELRRAVWELERRLRKAV